MQENLIISKLYLLTNVRRNKFHICFLKNRIFFVKPMISIEQK